MTAQEEARARAAYDSDRRKFPWWGTWDELPDPWRRVWLLVAETHTAEVIPFRRPGR
jgi:hypothetical protein